MAFTVLLPPRRLLSSPALYKPLTCAQSRHHPRAALPRRATITSCSNIAPARSPIVIDMADDTRLSFVFCAEAVGGLATELNALVRAFKEIKTAAADGKRVIAKSLEYVHEEEGMRVELECNPNLAPDAFQAKVWIVVDDGKVRVSGQAMLTRLIDNVKAYKAAIAA